MFRIGIWRLIVIEKAMSLGEFRFILLTFNHVCDV